MKRAALGLAAVGLMFGGTVAAVAYSPVQGKIEAATPLGAAFSGGKYKFNRPGINHGSFEWSGHLADTDANDRHNVYVEVKVHGHGWVRYYGKQRRSVWLHKSNWDGAQRYTGKVKLRVCRDRGALRPDNCAPEQNFLYNWDHR
ncbi:hypothetical protein [Streptomyces asoensis]|uniref:Uncharacterized protein n=1 Tax=Streptomyces asoensis TaxID=249586 RepID=A0ABQ3RSM6_9ACTN|nr:hypothetical protein [Streptomyces asoensis]GGQ47021.1 hypothetical protein GCM10010496_06080 [Streptomyces asoensis]GHI58865.1 hypothetical protein Saso_05150 [Streptomyces asoensis]